MKKRLFFLFFILFANLYSNELKNATSPYLLQHANNPVNWMSWSKKAFLKAKKENKLIFLSIGYSTCHWCHVMEEESFSDKEVAKILNKYYIAIKVDKEEYPQIDKYYQEIYHLLYKRGGGWPLNIILTPNGYILYAATYIPREGKFNQLGIIDLLKEIATAYHKNRSKFEKNGKRLQKEISNILNSSSLYKEKMSKNILRKFINDAKKFYDYKYKGFGKNIKFPNGKKLYLLLNIYILTKDKSALKFSKDTLTAMAKGGIYDQIEGGFFRYSTDRKWVIPHFEKMLYTNASLIKTYALAYKITKDNLFKNIYTQTINLFLDRYYSKKDKLFFSASDADSIDPKTNKKKEGFYYTYLYKNAYNFLKQNKIKEIKKSLFHYGITPEGNFIENRSNPYIANNYKVSSNIKSLLKDIRKKRAFPFIDKKLQTSWNALMADALFFANKDKEALAIIESILKNLYINNRLYHYKMPNSNAKIKGTLEDYSFFIRALIDGYLSTYNKKYLDIANNLTQEAIKKFKKENRWYLSTNHKIVQDLYEGSYENPLAVMVNNLLKLALLKSNLSYQNLAKEILFNNGKIINNSPFYAPSAIESAINYQKGFILAKVPKKFIPVLKEKIDYPLIIYIPSFNNLFEACKIDRCFIQAKSLKSFINKLRRSLGNN